MKPVTCRPRPSSADLLLWALPWLAALLLAAWPGGTRASTAVLANPTATKHGPAPTPAPAAPVAPQDSASAAKLEAPPVISIKSAVAQQLREAIEASNSSSGIRRKPVVAVSNPHDTAADAGHQNAAKSAPAASQAHAPGTVAVAKPKPHAAVSKAGAAHAATTGHGASGHDAPHWSYEGPTGPQAWGQLQPAFNVCAIGKRQSPIHIEESATLQGPAEPLQFNYQPSKGSVVNNGHTIQVDLEGDNTLTVRGSTYKLLQFHFHHPSEERINYKGFAMVAHLVHKNAEGQLAVLAVVFDPGEASPLIETVWMHMPLDVNDRVKLPDGAIDVNLVLPTDQHYYQFMGSLTTPPCTEGVLWLVLKTPMTLSRDQLKLFAKLFPNNARPIQPANDRVIREAR